MKVMMAAGGTGGHVIPAMTVARALKLQDPACTCVAVSGTRGMLSEVLWDPSVVALERIAVEPWPTRWQACDPRYWWRQGRAAARVWRVFRRVRPHVVVGFGGSVAGPTVLLARILGIPTVIHEQNVFPGRTTRLLVPWADRVAVSFEETRRHLSPHARVTVTGNPVRPEIEGCSRDAAIAALGLTQGPPVLLVMGGSQGSHRLNVVSVEAFARLTLQQRRGFQVVHVTGPQDRAWVAERYRALGIAGRIEPFMATMGIAYAAATLAVTRAGATTLSELVATATPAVLVPYPYAGAHQAVNAQWLSRRGGAVCVDQGVLTPEWFLNVVWPLLTDGPRLAAMRDSLRRVATPGAAQRVADAVLEVARAA